MTVCNRQEMVAERRYESKHDVYVYRLALCLMKQCKWQDTFLPLLLRQNGVVLTTVVRLLLACCFL